MSIPLSDSTTFVRDEMGGPGENGQTPPDDEDQGTVYVQGSGDVTVTVESYSCCAMKYSSPFRFTTCDAILRGCKIIGISKPLWRQGI